MNANAPIVETPRRARLSLTALATTTAVLTLMLGFDHLRHATPEILVSLPMAVAFSLPLAWAAFWLRGVNLSGALAGVFVSAMLLAGTGWQGWAMLASAFVMTTGATGMGRTQKMTLGIDEPRSGRRAAGNVIANTGMAALAAMFAPDHGSRATATLALCAALAAATSDSVASEIGKAWGRRPRMLLTGQSVPSGTTGAVSVVGTIAGIASAVVCAAIAVSVHLAPIRDVPIIAIAAIGASTAEGLISPSLEGSGWLDNDGINFVTTVLAVALAVAGHLLFS